MAKAWFRYRPGTYLASLDGSEWEEVTDVGSIDEARDLLSSSPNFGSMEFEETEGDNPPEE